ncbi:MAG: methyl-accepting chemotaxis protein [Polyangiaceae bacterium]
MFKNLRLGTRLAVGFGVVLLLTLLIAGAGFRGVTNVEARAQKSDDAQRIQDLLRLAEIAQQRYVLHEDDASAEAVKTNLDALVAQALANKATHAQQANRDQMDRIVALARGYEKGFLDYAANVKKGKDAEAKIVESGRAVEQLTLVIQDRIVVEDAADKTGEGDSLRLKVLIDADRASALMLQARRHEKNFQLRGDRKYVDQVKEATVQAEALMNKVREDDPRPEQLKSADEVLKAIAVYKASFDVFVGSIDERHALEASFVKAADAIAREADESAEDQEAKMKAEMTAVKGQVSVLAVVATLLGILVSVAFVRSLVTAIRQAVGLADRIASGDLTARIVVDRGDEIGQLLGSLASMSARLNEIVARVHAAADEITTAAGEISSGNTDLSERTSSQASSLEETAASMEELTSTVRQNTEHAAQADRLAGDASRAAQGGSEVLGRTIQAMGGIRDASKKIEDIIGVIDELAFQTNLLALNAAVEAARAGDQGRGFAVVAGEVRKLAQRSAEAAKEIAGLIHDSVERVDQGARLVDASGKSLGEIQGAVQKVNSIVSGITSASREQADGIEQVNQAITAMDSVTQQNSALVEEAAAAAETLAQQAAELKRMIDFFKVDADSRSPAQREQPVSKKTKPPVGRLAHAHT